MKKKKKKKIRQKQRSSGMTRIGRDIYAITMLSSGVLIFFSSAFKLGTVGPAGDFIKRLSYGLFGPFSALFIPLSLVVFSFLVLVNKAGRKHFRLLLRIILFLILSSAIINVAVYTRNNIGALGVFDAISKYYALGISGEGGGAVAAILSVPLALYLKTLGSLVVISALALIDLILITEFSFSSAFSGLFSFIGKISKRRKLAKKTTGVQIKKTKAVKQTVIKSKIDMNQLEISKMVENSVDNDQTTKKTTVVKNVKPASAPVTLKAGKNYSKPPLYLLKSGGSDKATAVDLKKSALERAGILVETLKSFNVEADIVNISIGPNVTQYELTPKRGVKVSRIVSLADDIALNLAAADVRIEAPIPGKAAIGIEVPNEKINMVHLKEIIESAEFKNNDSRLTFALGKDISGNPVTGDIGRMPHLLIAGATGSGKSVCINNLILSLLFNASPDEVKLILIDPKVVELKVYDGIPHLLVPVVTDPRKAAGALIWAVNEMNRRYSIFADASVKDFKSYNREVEKINSTPSGERKEKIPYIVVIIDELADLMAVAPNEVEDSICRLAQMARAAGIHLVLATQRPSVNVITGLIKANIPSRISFAVSAQVDSRTILDMGGAEKLIGKGDMLYLPIGLQKPKRLQGAFVSDREVEAVVDFVKASAKAEYDDDAFTVIDSGALESGHRDGERDEVDEFLAEAIRIVVETGNASASLLQRKLKVGYARAGRLVDQMAERNIVGPYAGSKPREVLITKEEFYELEMKRRNNGGK